MIVAIFLGSLIGAMALGMPIALALLVSGLALMFTINMFDSQIMAQLFIDGADSFPMLAIPFFILAGELMNAGGISKRIINFAMALVGHIKGGLGYVAIIASVIFAGLSGSAVADTAALGAILIPMMVSKGYDKKQSAGLIAAGGIIAPIIPPSIPMIIFGVVSGVSITKLFMADSERLDKGNYQCNFKGGMGARFAIYYSLRSEVWHIYTDGSGSCSGRLRIVRRFRDLSRTEIGKFISCVGCLGKNDQCRYVYGCSGNGIVVADHRSQYTCRVDGYAGSIDG
jgi:hypothetical protein